MQICWKSEQTQNAEKPLSKSIGKLYILDQRPHTGSPQYSGVRKELTPI